MTRKKGKPRLSSTQKLTFSANLNPDFANYRERDSTSNSDESSIEKDPEELGTRYRQSREFWNEFQKEAERAAMAQKPPDRPPPNTDKALEQAKSNQENLEIQQLTIKDRMSKYEDTMKDLIYMMQNISDKLDGKADKDTVTSTEQIMEQVGQQFDREKRELEATYQDLKQRAWENSSDFDSENRYQRRKEQNISIMETNRQIPQLGNQIEQMFREDPNRVTMKSNIARLEQEIKENRSNFGGDS